VNLRKDHCRCLTKDDRELVNERRRGGPPPVPPALPRRPSPRPLGWVRGDGGHGRTPARHGAKEHKETEARGARVPGAPAADQN